MHKLMSNLSRPETLWVPHQSLRLYKLPCSASEASWTVNEFSMWTLLVLCSVIAAPGVQGIVHYFLIVSLDVDACATLTFCPVCLFVFHYASGADPVQAAEKMYSTPPPPPPTPTPGSNTTEIKQ